MQYLEYASRTCLLIEKLSKKKMFPTVVGLRNIIEDREMLRLPPVAELSTRP
jgi:hypothetical protein